VKRFALALALAAAVAPAQAQMYKCVDERGVTHYSDKPRPGCKGGPVDIRGSPPISGSLSAPPAAGDLTRQDADFKRRQMEQEKAQSEQKAALDQRCHILRQELALLTSGVRIGNVTSKGEREYMDDKTRDARAASLREQLRGCP
jgi:hypothetical protein